MRTHSFLRRRPRYSAHLYDISDESFGRSPGKRQRRPEPKAKTYRFADDWRTELADEENEEEH